MFRTQRCCEVTEINLVWDRGEFSLNAIVDVSSKAMDINRHIVALGNGSKFFVPEVPPYCIPRLDVQFNDTGLMYHFCVQVGPVECFSRSAP